MKKHLAILTVAVLVMLAGCGSGAEAPRSDDEGLFIGQRDLGR